MTARAAHAQGLRLTGRVLRVTAADSAPLPGVRVILHRFSPTGAAETAQTRSDGEGRFTLAAGAGDTAGTYVVSVQYGGIAYFSQLVAPGPVPTAAVPPIVVYDTSSTDPPIHVGERQVLVAAPGDDGASYVVDALTLVNRGRRTRVAPRDGQVVWRGRIARGAANVQVAGSDFSDDAVLAHGDTVEVIAAFPPGQRRVTLTYLLPRRTRHLELALGQPVERLALLLGDGQAEPEGPGLTLEGAEPLGDEVVRRFRADTVPAGTTIVVALSSGGHRAEAWWWVVPTVTVLVLGATLVHGLRRLDATPLAPSASG